MEPDANGQILDERYPARRVLNLIADKWTPIVMHCLAGGTRRMASRSSPTISALALSAPIDLSKHEGDLITEWATQVGSHGFGLLVGLFGSVILVMAVNTAGKQVGNAVVRFLPPQVETSPQGTTTVALIIENATDVTSAPMQVTFDPKVVKLNDAGRGDFGEGVGHRLAVGRVV